MLHILVAMLIATVALPALAQRVTAEVACKPTGKALAYDCAIKLTEALTGKPIEGAKLSVGADMPSMPMAHNVRPVVAKPGPMPGDYVVRLVLEMHGEWALKLRVSAPVPDQIVTKVHFE